MLFKYFSAGVITRSPDCADDNDWNGSYFFDNCVQPINPITLLRRYNDDDRVIHFESKRTSHIKFWLRALCMGA